MTTFRTVLEATGGNNVGIVVPGSAVLAFNRGKRVPVIVTIDGSYTYKTTIGVMGGRCLVSFNAETASRRGAARATRSKWNWWPTPSAEGQLGGLLAQRMRHERKPRGGRCSSPDGLVDQSGSPYSTVVAAG
jgi:hypothetical protein